MINFYNFIIMVWKMFKLVMLICGEFEWMNRKLGGRLFDVVKNGLFNGVGW
jgi:hypothetical protein